MSIQDRCTICTEHVVVKKIVLGLPDGTPRWHVMRTSLAPI
jgi:hypothetical protein